MKHTFNTLIILLVLSVLSVAEPLITCEPRELRGLPGEPLQMEITIITDRASPAQLRIPHLDNLHLHTVEKIPIQRTKTGQYVQKRIIIWQGLEAGSMTITNLTVVTAGGGINFQGLEKPDQNSPMLGKEKEHATQLLPSIGKKQQALTQSAPSIGIVIDTVEPAAPPKKEPAE